MLKSGFQPVCVLYQGNQSPFDGSCQLVCRHQIQEKNFSQGDTVTVIDFLESGGSSNGKDGPVCRRANVMGQEMVSTLLGTLFQTKHSEEPNSSKKRKTSDEEEGQRNDKSRQEEIGLLRGVFSAVKGLREEVSRQGKEISHMKQRQIQMMNLLDGVLRRQGAMVKGAPIQLSSEDVASPNIMPIELIKAEEAEEDEKVEAKEISGPIITSVRSTSTGMTGCVQDEASSPVSEPGSGTFEEDLVYSALDMSPGQDQGWQQDPGTSLMYMDNRKGYLAQYQTKRSHGDNVEIGNLTFKVMMTISELEDILYKTDNVKSFAYRLASKCFTSREMLEGNTSGGQFRTDGEVFKQLNPDVVEMIVGEVKKRFPLNATEVMLNRSVKNAINERARNERKRVARVQVP